MQPASDQFGNTWETTGKRPEYITPFFTTLHLAMLNCSRNNQFARYFLLFSAALTKTWPQSKSHTHTDRHTNIESFQAICIATVELSYSLAQPAPVYWRRCVCTLSHLSWERARTIQSHTNKCGSNVIKDYSRACSGNSKSDWDRLRFSFPKLSQDDPKTSDITVKSTSVMRSYMRRN